ncbi:MAG: hypothetical protein F6K30_16555 [Cyanothece sp. SIO2G6]|nr:hypothetical protein [Cyanothece sp. SIO2G6]
MHANREMRAIASFTSPFCPNRFNRGVRPSLHCWNYWEAAPSMEMAIACVRWRNTTPAGVSLI